MSIVAAAAIYGFAAEGLRTFGDSGTFGVRAFLALQETFMHDCNRPTRKVLIGTMLTALLVAATANSDSRDDCVRSYQPQTGQAGKDVVWVPTNDALVKRMLTMAAVTAHDLVYDLGAGDGKIAIAAARDFGARAVGIEYNPDLARLAQCMARAEGVDEPRPDRAG